MTVCCPFAIGTESELRDSENLAADIVDTEIHLSVFVLEHAQTRYFAGEQRRLLIGVALDNAEQDIKALPISPTVFPPTETFDDVTR